MRLHATWLWREVKADLKTLFVDNMFAGCLNISTCTSQSRDVMSHDVRPLPHTQLSSNRGPVVVQSDKTLQITGKSSTWYGNTNPALSHHMIVDIFPTPAQRITKRRILQGASANDEDMNVKYGHAMLKY